MSKNTSLIVRLCVVLIISTCFAHLAQGGFISHSLDPSAGNGQNHKSDGIDISVDVTTFDSKIAFNFYNDSDESLHNVTITNIYFEQNTFLGAATIIEDHNHTSFSSPAVPGHLPAGHKLSPYFDDGYGYSAGADAPSPKNGINPGESITIEFDLLHDITPADVIFAISSRNLGIATSVTSFPGAPAELFVIPEPATCLLLTFGAVFIRKRKK